jgi:hypothetical protein
LTQFPNNERDVFIALDLHFHFQSVVGEGEEMFLTEKTETGWSDFAAPTLNQTYLTNS